MGGLGGSIKHVNNIIDITFDELKQIFIDLYSNKLDVYEKTDGQNLFFSVIDKKIVFARNKSQIETRELNSIESIKNKFKHSPVISKVFCDVYKFLTKNLTHVDYIESIFENGKYWCNCEVVDSRSINVIKYQFDFIHLHSVIDIETNENLQHRLDLLANITFVDLSKFIILPPTLILISFDQPDKYIDNVFFNFMNTINYKLSDKIWQFYKDDIAWKYYKFCYMTDTPIDLINNDLHNMFIRIMYGKSKVKLNLDNFSSKEVISNIKIFEKTYDKNSYNSIIEFISELGILFFKKSTGYITTDKFNNKYILDQIYERTIYNPDAHKYYTILHALKYETSTMNIEGVIFKYNNDIYKLTGVYSYINKIIGFIG